MRLAVLVIVAACSARPEAPAVKMRAGIVGHRGASKDAPENTLASCRLAWDRGAESCEIDVRLTADDVPVLIHDETTDRTAGKPGVVADLTLDELQAIDPRIPTLASVIAAIPPGRELFIEIKSAPDTVPTVVSVIEAANPAPGSIAMQSYDAVGLAAAAALLPDVPTYWDLDPPYTTDIIDACKRHGFTGLALDFRGVDDALADAILAAGLQLDVWVVDDPAQQQAWLDRGARYVETDVP